MHVVLLYQYFGLYLAKFSYTPLVIIWVVDVKRLAKQLDQTQNIGVLLVGRWKLNQRPCMFLLASLNIW